MRHYKFKSSLLSLGVISALGISDIAAAQQQMLEEIVVTARKRAENIQSVPMSVSAFSADQLQQGQVDNILDLERMTPNITVSETGGLVAGAVSIFMRGIGNDSGFDQGVGIYVDDVYINRTTGALLDVYDVERIEILKGPQGSFYGRNTIGGAIKYVSREPSEAFEADVALKMGDYDLVQLNANVSGPLIADTLYGGFGAMSKSREGIQTNTFDGGEYWGEDAQAYRANLVFTPTDSLRIKLAGDYSKDESDPRVPNRLAVDPVTLGGIDFVISGANTYLGPGLGLVDTPNDQSLPVDIDTVSTEFVAGFDQYEIEASTLALTVDWDISDHWTLKSITAQRSMDNVQPFDFDGSEQAFITTTNFRESDDFTQEFQFNYSGESLDAVLGLYYLDGRQESPGITYQNLRLRAVQTHTKTVTKDRRDIESLSAYANIDWDFSENWQLSLGGRYTQDEKTEVNRATVDQGIFALAGLTGFPPSAIVSIEPGKEAAAEQSPLFAYWIANPQYIEFSLPEDTDANETWNEFTPSARLSYRLNDDTLVYGGFSSGFKSGGFQRTGGVATAYEPEVVDSWTLGLKTTLLDGSLRLNTELFYNDYTDKQLSTIVLNGASLDETVGNVGEMETSGGEVEILWLPPVEGLQLGLNVGYLDTDIKQYLSNDTDISDQTEIGFSPKWTAQARVNYDFSLVDIGFLNIGADLSYRDDSYTNSPIDIGDPFADVQVQEAHTIYNAAIAFRSTDEHWRIAVEGKNLGDKRVLTNSFVVGPFVTGAYNMPRTVAVSLGYTF